MSHKSYTKWWIASKAQLEDVRIRDQIAQDNLKEIKSRSIANNLVGGLFARYSMVVQNLTACLDQYCQSQKRITMRKLVEAATTRLNEFKEELIKVNFSEYHYIDGNLVELRLIPHQVEILDTAFVCERELNIEDLWTQIKNGETIFEPPPPPPEERVSVGSQVPELEAPPEEPQITPEEEAAIAESAAAAAAEEEKKSKRPDKRRKPSVQKYVPPVPVYTPEQIAEMERLAKINEVVLCFQSHERGRQSRLYYEDLDVRRQLRKTATSGKLKLVIPPEIQDNAAKKIQRVFRGHAARKYLKRREDERRLLIGMTEPSWKSTEEQKKVQHTVEKRRALREKNLREYVETNSKIKERVLRVVAPGLMEDIGDEIRQWFYQFYIRARCFLDIPPVELGGSVLIVRGEVFTPEKWIDEVERLRKEKENAKEKKKDDKAAKNKLKKQLAAEKKKALDTQKKLAAEAKKKEMAGEFDFEFAESPAAQKFSDAFKEYAEICDERPDSDNPDQKLYMDMIGEEKCHEMQLEVRKLVDELMRAELDLLKDAFERDRGKKYKPKRVKTKKEKNKDPTANRTTEDLFQELTTNGIIHPYPKGKLSDFFGDFSYGNWDRRMLDMDPPATLGDVRQAVQLNCILPMAVKTLPRPKSVLIAGHRQSGKHVLANAIFNETKCVLFDLSPPILAGKYPGKQGMKMLVHLINKMSRILQPSIIYIDGAEKTFYKKVPPSERRQDPKKMAKDLFKGIVKMILPEDKVLLLGISGQPYAAQAGGLKKAYERVILIPRTDYGSLYMYWRSLLMAYHGIDRDFNVSELAMLSKYRTLPTIKDVVETVLTPARLVQLSYKPLDAHELIEVLLDAAPAVKNSEWSKFQKWFDKTPLEKRRGLIIRIAAELKAAEAKKKEKKK